MSVYLLKKNLDFNDYNSWSYQFWCHTLFRSLKSKKLDFNKGQFIFGKQKKYQCPKDF